MPDAGKYTAEIGRNAEGKAGSGDPAVAAPVAAPEANVGDAMRQASRRAQLKNPGGRSK
ncbi:hypothetical protein LBMAG56_38510 [Verrucomicrobiota bacterium]|nr:hypothetical protein LBMAG56_38510 [Verrucomicrobiota bacterium]